LRQAILAFKRANRPGLQQQSSQHELQQGSQQLGAQQLASQPQLGSAHPQPMPQNAEAFEALASAMATPRPNVDKRKRFIGRAPKSNGGNSGRVRGHRASRPRPVKVDGAEFDVGITLESPAGDATDTLSHECQSTSRAGIP
jgi:hypothetical protein